MPESQMYMLSTIIEMIAVVAIASATPSPMFFGSEFSTILNLGLQCRCGAHYSSSCRAAKSLNEPRKEQGLSQILMRKHMNNMAI